MDEKNSIIEFDHIRNMLDNDPAYLKEFSEAAVISFTEYKKDYKESMLSGDLENLRKAGHRIKPAAELIGVHQIVTEYENAKKILQNNGSDQKIQNSVEKVQAICNQIIEDFRQRINQF